MGTSSYYYFIASLPMILWDGKLPMSGDEFLSHARRLLAGNDYELVEKLFNEEEDVKTDNTAALSWIKFNRNFRNEIAWFRAHRAHRDPLKHIRGTYEHEPSLREAVHEASRILDLLEAEKLLDQRRWQFLDDLAVGHYFDLEFLICYGLKLKILERHYEYKSPKGKVVFEEIKAMELPVDWVVSGI